MSLKNPVTPPGIDRGTVRLLAQRLNHYAIPGPAEITFTVQFSVQEPRKRGRYGLDGRGFETS